MTDRAARIAVWVAALVAASGCATTRVTTSEPGARIWFDGRPVPRSGEVRSVGPPHTARVVVISKDGRRARALVSRRLALGTVEHAFYTMGACLLLCWEYPAEVHVPLEPAPRRPGWDDATADRAWLAPPGGGAPQQRTGVARRAPATTAPSPSSPGATPTPPATRVPASLPSRASPPISGRPR